MCSNDFLAFVQILGMSPVNLRLLKADSTTCYMLTPALLAEAVAADVAAGLIPFFLCATVLDAKAVHF
jgi:tyrosine decarboxylase